MRPEDVDLATAASPATSRSRSAASQAWRTGTPTRCRPASSRGCTRSRSTRRRTSTPPDAEDRVASSARARVHRRRRRRRGRPRDRPVAVLDYVTVHDAGRLLNPLLADGQVRGGFAHGVGAALFERHRLRRGRQPAHGVVHGLPLPDGARSAAAADRPPRDALPVHAARREGPRRGQHDERAGGDRERRRRCARPRPRRAAADPAARVGAALRA